MSNRTDFITVREIAKRMGVTRGRVYQRVAAGEIPAVRDGRAIRIPALAWQQWLEIQPGGRWPHFAAREAPPRNRRTQAEAEKRRPPRRAEAGRLLTHQPDQEAEGAFERTRLPSALQALAGVRATAAPQVVRGA